MVLNRQAPIEQEPLELQDIQDPEPGPGEVRVRVSVCAICRTDLHVVEGDLDSLKLPLVPGHQIVGRIDKLGSECRSMSLGQRVGIAWLRGTDGTCSYCASGRENLCPNAQFTGYTENGGYAEFAVVREDFAYPLPDSYTDEEISPLLCAGLIGYRSYRRASVPENGDLLLVGFGSSAHIVIQIAVYHGHRVFVVSRSRGHRDLCLRLGATLAGATCEELPAKVDSAILFAPVGDLVLPMLASLKPGGVLSIAGIHLSDVPVLNYQRHLFMEREVRSVTANTRQDGRELLAEAEKAGVRPVTTCYDLADANRALIDLKQDRINGTGVLRVSG
jgi:propanol-preferring alcohol dehydrogenase